VLTLVKLHTVLVIGFCRLNKVRQGGGGGDTQIQKC